MATIITTSAVIKSRYPHAFCLNILLKSNAFTLVRAGRVLCFQVPCHPIWNGFPCGTFCISNRSSVIVVKVLFVRCAFVVRRFFLLTSMPPLYLLLFFRKLWFPLTKLQVTVPIRSIRKGIYIAKCFFILLFRLSVSGCSTCHIRQRYSVW